MAVEAAPVEAAVSPEHGAAAVARDRGVMTPVMAVAAASVAPVARVEPAAAAAAVFPIRSTARTVPALSSSTTPAPAELAVLAAPAGKAVTPVNAGPPTPVVFET